MLKKNKTPPHDITLKTTKSNFCVLKQSISFTIACWIKRSEERYPFEKSWCINVDGAAPLSYHCRSILTLVFTDDLAVYKHRDQWTLWESSYIRLMSENTSCQKTKQTNKKIRNQSNKCVSTLTLILWFSRFVPCSTIGYISGSFYSQLLCAFLPAAYCMAICPRPV